MSFQDIGSAIGKTIDSFIAWQMNLPWYQLIPVLSIEGIIVMWALVMTWSYRRTS